MSQMPASPTSIFTPERKWTAAAVTLIFSVVVVSYYNALSGGFITDDYSLVVWNPNVKSWESLFRIFTSGYWDAAGCTRGLYRPLAILSFLIEHPLAGVNPFVYHLDNVLLHFLCSVLCYLVIKEIFNKKDVAVIAAVLFAVHPVHTEAVSWVSGRAELLSAFFALLSILVFIKNRASKPYYILSIVLYFLGLLSKESAAVVPIILAAYILLFDAPERGRLKRAAYLVLPFMGVLLMFIVLKKVIIGSVGPQEWDQALYGVDAYHRALAMGVALFEYVRLSFLPFGLRADYFFPPPASFLNIKVMFSAAMLVSALILSRKAAERSKLALFAATWFFVTLLPVSNIVPAGIVMSERALYMPSLGVCLLIGGALSYAGSLPGRAAGRRLFTVLPAAVIVVLFAAGVSERNKVWHNMDTFIKAYVDVLDKGLKENPDYVPLYKQAARIRFRFCGDSPETRHAILEAIKRVGPDFELHAMLAGLYSNLDMPDKALIEIRQAIKMFPQNYYYNFEAMLLLEMGNLKEAEDAVDEALRLNDREQVFHITKGNILMAAGDYQGALRQFEVAAWLNPDNPAARVGEGAALDAGNDFGQAVEKIKEAINIVPGEPDYHLFLVAAYLDGGMPDQAAGELDVLLRIKPGSEEADNLLKSYGTGRGGNILPALYLKKAIHPKTP